MYDVWNSGGMKKLDALFEELVPVSGAAETKAGEIVRAAMRIIYRYWNDGDQIGLGYGNETCNAAARYLRDEWAGTEVSDVVDALWGLPHERVYEISLGVLAEKVVELIESNPELREAKNEDDMLDYSRPEDTGYEEEEEYEEYTELHPWAVYDPGV